MPHIKHDIFENRKEFQLERMILFSDAVFAIAITLLILEIKLPEKLATTPSGVLNIIENLIPDFIGFVSSFIIIGMFWITHHRLFGNLIGFDNKLLWLNLHVLFWIVVMPLSTHLNMQYGGVDLVWFFYSLNLTFISYAILLIWQHTNKNKSLSFVSEDKIIMKYGRLRSLMTTIVFLVGGSLIFLPWEWAKWASHFFFFLLFSCLMLIKNRPAATAKK